MGTDAGTKTTRRPWWLPLLIPVAFLTLISAVSVHRGAHVVHQDVGAAIIGATIIAIAIGAPAFFAGVRYHRSRSNS